jgi:ketosteroid isomerase-like protein
MTHLNAAEFAQRWLPAWTGNDPERLAAFCSDDALYVDPGIDRTELRAEIEKRRAEARRLEESG